MSRRIAIVTALATLGLALVALTFIPLHATAQIGSTSGFVVDQTYDAIWGTVAPGAIVTVSRGTAYGAAQADGVGSFWTPLWQSNGQPADITGTDIIRVYVNGSLSATITVSGVTGLVDVLNDRVVGKLGGVTAPTPVTITLGTNPGVPSASATTDASGRFTATFTTVDLNPGRNAVVEYHNGPHTLRAFLAPSQVFAVDLGWNSVGGYAQPGQTVTATVYRGNSSLTKTVMTGQANKPQGYYDFGPSDGTVINGGDVVKVNLGSGMTISTTAVTITMHTNPTTDLVTGTAPAGARLRASLSQWTDDKNRYYQVTTTANATGVYTANFSGVADVQVYDWVGVAVADSKGNETNLWSGAPMISVDESNNSLWARVNGPNLAVTATLDTGSGTFTQTGTSGLQHFVSLGRFPGEPDIQPGHHITVKTVSWMGVITVANLSASLDTTGNRLLGNAPAGRAQAEVYHGWSDRYPAGLGGVIRQITATSPFTLTYANFDVRDGDSIWLTSHDSNGFDTGRWIDSRVFQVQVPNGVGAPQFSPSDVLTATLYQSDGVTVKRQTSKDNDSNSTWYWMDMQGEIAVGDWVTVTDGAGWTAGLQVPTLTAQANAATDLIWGKGPKSLLLVQRNWDWQSARFVPCDDYKLDAAYFGEDLLPDDRIQTTYFALNGNRVVREFEFPWTRVNYGHDWVEANYEAGHTVWITLTNSSGTVKATAVLTTGLVPDWGGQTGFSTNWQGWIPSQPDIVPGDWVYVRVDDGYASTVRVGTITGNVSSASDSISGTITANWFTQTLNVRCEVWVPNGPPGIDMTVNPNGGSYSCDFSTVGWDVLPGQDVAVLYSEPDRDQVINVFREPVPHLRINKNADGNPGEDSNFVFHIQYWNDGEGSAENTVITDTLLGGMTYLTDTSGFSHSGSGNGPIVWNLGSVPARSWGSFDVFVHITAVESETITNTVQIATGNPYDEGDAGEKQSTWSGHVEADDTHLNVGKGAWTGDPVPGYDFVYSVNTCNNGSTASNQVTLTDTLHLSTTLKYWWAQNPGWTGVYSDAHTLVVSRPSVPGGWCGEVYLRVRLDENAWQGMSISNTAVISASNDLESNDNESTWWGNVGNPHTNLGITQYWVEGGQLVPGGEFFYAIQYNNNGNVPASNVRITATLPVSTSFSRAWRWTDYGEQPFTPTLVTANYVVWGIGTLDNGYNDKFGLALRVDNGASPGTVLTGTVKISPQPDEDRYDDNQATWVEVLNSSGPNLRVSKWYRWENQDRIRYGIWIQNVGTTRMENIWITDTYPLSTTSDGNFWVGHGPWYTHTLDATNRRFVVWAEALDPGSTGQFGFWVNLDGALHGVEGLVFTNTVVAPWPGDVYPADNRDVELAYTGPDVYVEKWLSGGEPKAGAIVTFTVEFGNRNQWPWEGDSSYDSHITDTLPAGMQFITATVPWRPNERWTPESIAGNTIVWDWGTMWSNSAWQFDVVVRITNTVQIGQVFTNTVTARGDSPDDVEPNYQNNVVRATVALPEYRIYLPLVRKN